MFGSLADFDLHSSQAFDVWLIVAVDTSGLKFCLSKNIGQEQHGNTKPSNHQRPQTKPAQWSTADNVTTTLPTPTFWYNVSPTAWSSLWA